ncbi:hypothetical protein [Prescottella sp. R16]|uniref:hypothetical protein n=1 Tax=Prescottella sp. R16 TaxID=3064529 RepID=UPI00272E659D|nr:hypothetical protein [Prescottella sp. R16]
MNLRTASAATVLAVAALGVVGAGTATADTPTPPPPLTKQAAQDRLFHEIEVGWNNGGAQATLNGAGTGLAVGCVSIFPNFVAGCIVGTAVGAGIGAYNGITAGNPDVEPAFYDWLNAAP